MYFLTEASDAKITATFDEDYRDLWTEDVFEVFLWPDEREPIYFEYEVSPLDRELPILVPNLGGKFLGWRPWHYDGERKTRKATSAVGGAMKSGGAVSGWKAEFFIPYALLNPMRNPSRPGRHAMAGELLSHGLRRRQGHGMGLVPRRAAASTNSRSSARSCLNEPGIPRPAAPEADLGRAARVSHHNAKARALRR